MIEIPDGVIRTREGIYVLKNDTHLSRWIEEAGRLDLARDEIDRCFAKYIPDGGVVVDAGASLGDHTLTYSKLVGESGRVVAFEPNPLSFFCVRENMGNRINTFCVHAALSNTSHPIRMVQNANVGASHVEIATIPKDDEPLVMAAALDVFSAKFHRLDFIHLDVEGYELNALVGAQNTLLSFRPVVAMEINKGCLARLKISEDMIREYMSNLQYSFEETEPGYGPHMEQRDIIAIPNERA